MGLSQGDVADLEWVFCHSSGDVSGIHGMPVEPGAPRQRDYYDPTIAAGMLQLADGRLTATARERRIRRILAKVERRHAVALRALFGPLTRTALALRPQLGPLAPLARPDSRAEKLPAPALSELRSQLARVMAAAEGAYVVARKAVDAQKIPQETQWLARL